MAKKNYQLGVKFLNLIYPLHVILIALYFFSIPVNDLHLVLGKNDFSVKDEPYGFLIRKLQTVIIHPKYNTYVMEHDLALLRFKEPVQFQPNVLPVCIPEDDSNFAGFSAHITGWGTLHYGKTINYNILIKRDLLKKYYMQTKYMI